MIPQQALYVYIQKYYLKEALLVGIKLILWEGLLPLLHKFLSLGTCQRDTLLFSWKNHLPVVKTCCHSRYVSGTTILTLRPTPEGIAAHLGVRRSLRKAPRKDDGRKRRRQRVCCWWVVGNDGILSFLGRIIGDTVGDSKRVHS